MPRAAAAAWRRPTSGTCEDFAHGLGMFRPHLDESAMSSPPPVVQALAVRLALNFESKPKDMGLCYTGGAGDRCWVQGMFRGYVSRHHELLYLQFRGYVTGYVSGVCFAGVQQCNPCALLKSGPKPISW